jgi:CHAT domain-containing protein/tetratricopeptide (TPR) repeat protein
MSRCRSLAERFPIPLLFLVLLLASPTDSHGKASSQAAGFDPAERKALNKLVDDGRFQEAEEGARKLLDRVRSAGAQESRDGVLTVQVLIYGLLRGGKANAAETREIAELSLSLSEKILGPDDPLTATSAADLGGVLLAHEDFDGAKGLFERGLRIREKAFGPESIEVANSLHDLTRLYLTLHDPAQAKPLLERELEIKEKVLGPDHPRLSGVLNNLGVAAHASGDYEGSRKLFERSLAIAEKSLGPDHPKLTNALDNLANVLDELGDYPAALRLHERSLSILEKTYPPDHPDIGRTLYGIASIYFELGDFQRATELDERELAIAEKASGPESLDVGRVLQGLGRIREALHDHDGALRYLERALQISEKTLGPDSLQAADRLISIAEVREAMGDDGGAEPLYRRALKIYQGAEVDQPHASHALLAIGLIRLRAGDFAQATDLLEKSKGIRESTYGPESPLVAECQEGIALVRWGEGRFPEALDLALAAQAKLRSQFQRTASNLAEREALRYERILNSARNLVLSITTDAPAGSLPPGASGRAWEEVIRSRAIVLDEAARRHRAVVAGEGLEAAALWKSLVAARNLLASLTVQGPDPEDPGSFREELDRATGVRDRAERALADKSAAFRRSLRDREVALVDIEGRLPAGSALVAYVRYDRLPVPKRPAAGGSAAAPAARDTAAGLAPAPPQACYLAAVLAPGKKPRLLPLGPAGEMEGRVSRWRSEIAAGATAVGALGRSTEARYREAGSRLREAMWDPVEPALRGAKRVFVVPDGALNLVNPSALPTGERGYLLERGPVLHLLSAERDLMVEAAGSRRAGPVFILGGPDFNVLPRGSGLPPPEAKAAAGETPSGPGWSEPPAVFRSVSPSCVAFRDVRFDPLPASAREAAEIGTLLGARKGEAPGLGQPVEVMSGIAATESALKRHAPDARILHLATHAFFAEGQCESLGSGSRTGEARAPRVSGEPIPSAGDNPLLLSGLALAGANRRGDAAPGDEDGILTAEEIASLDLSGVEWAVLSACETGVGRIQPGEGVLGLRRAFQVAGAGSVIMSLWKVEDDSARKWMGALYEGRLKGLSTVEAVRNASLTILGERRRKGQSTHPFYWGAFLAAGDWR